MASNDDNSKPQASADSSQTGRPKAQPQTIDLKASEVSEKPEEGKSAENTDGKATAKPSGSAASSAAKTEPKSEPKPSESKNAQTPKSPPSPPPPPGNGSGSGLITGALGGGVVGAALVYGLVYFGLVPGAGESDQTIEQIAQLQQSVAAVTAQVESVEPVAAVDLSGIESTIETLQSEFAAIGTSEPDTGALDALTERITTLENTAIQAEGAGDGVAEGLASRLDAIEAQSAETAAAIETLQTELADIASSVPGETASVDLSGIEARITELETATAGTGDAIASAVASIPAPDLSTVESAQATLSTSVADLTDRASALEEQVSALSTIVEGLSSDLANVQSSTGALDDERRTAYLVALSGLQRASAGSGPFSAELNAVKSLADDDGAFSELSGFAETGVPSAAELARSFSGLTGSILDETAKASADSVIGRLAAGAQTLVRIRPTGYVAGDSPAAAVARIEALLGDGKLSAALDEWETLPEAGKAASASWAASLRNRLALNAALSGTSATN